MAPRLQGLPKEVLLELFKHSDTIDDALHLGRSCRELHEVLDGHRLPIMKAIILKSDVHEYDIKLCRFIDVYYAFASNHFAVPMHYDDDDAEDHPKSTVIQDCYKATTLTDGNVWDIVARWHGLRVFHDLYLHSSIQSHYAKSALPYDVDSEGDQFDALVEESILDVVEEVQTCQASNASNAPNLTRSLSASVSSDFKMRKRFHKALTGHWLANEVLRLAKACKYKTQSQMNETFVCVEAEWIEFSVTLQDCIDRVEVYDFTYGYLLRQVDLAFFDKYQEWLGDFEHDHDTEDEAWNYFVGTVRLNLSPPDILELLLHTSNWEYTPSDVDLEWAHYRKLAYLGLRGFLNPSFRGQVAKSDVSECYTEWYSIATLEENVSRNLEDTLGISAGRATKLFHRYRTSGAWQQQIRGALFRQESSDAQIRERITTSSWQCQGSVDADIDDDGTSEDETDDGTNEDETDAGTSQDETDDEEDGSVTE